MPTLLVVGTGSLARSVVGSLAVLPPVTEAGPLRLIVAGRDPARVAQTHYLAATRAAVAGRSMTLDTAVVDADDDQLADLLAATRPDGVLVCASAQSPWESRTAPSAWTSLLLAGFGLALPLQATLAYRIGRVLPAAAPGAWLVNACYPDAVNPLLTELGIPVLCGIGNVATLAASVQAGLDPAARPGLRMVAHHTHLHRPADAADEALAFLGEEPITDLTDRLAGMRATPRTELNAVTGLAGADVLRGLLAGTEVRASLPGPLGLPGGYPVILRAGSVHLDLPAALSQADAVAHNQHWAWLDGVRVADGRVAFAPPLRTALARHLPALADGFVASDLTAVTAELSALADHLRGRPAPSAPPTPIREGV